MKVAYVFLILLAVSCSSCSILTEKFKRVLQEPLRARNVQTDVPTVYGSTDSTYITPTFPYSYTGCFALSCAALGEPCGSPTYGEVTTCNTGSYCNGTACAPLKANSEHCTSRFACRSGECLGGICTALVNGPGHLCTADNECVFYNGTTINKCVDGACFGVATGSACNPNVSQTGGECQNGYCDPSSSLCLAFKGVGESCDSALSVCNLLLLCSVTTTNSAGVCTVPNQGSLGDYCENDQTCPDGSWCYGSFCTAVPTQITHEGCSALHSSCETGHCTCDYGTGESECAFNEPTVLAGTAAAELALVNCVLTHNCAYYDGKCFSANCLSETCAYFTLSLETSIAAANNAGLPECYIDNLRNGSMATAEKSPTYAACFGNQNPITTTSTTASLAATTATAGSTSTVGTSSLETSTSASTVGTAPQSVTSSSSSVTGSAQATTSRAATSVMPVFVLGVAALLSAAFLL